MKKNAKKNQERECKWKAHSLSDYHSFLQLAQNLGAKLSHSKQVKIKDLYLDTHERFFERAHLQCRIRLFDDGHSEMTVKNFSASQQGLFIRDERTIALPHFTSQKEALSHCRYHFFKKIAPLVEILNNRQIHTLTLPCGISAEASFDQAVICCRNEKFQIHEIELEFKSGVFEEFIAFANQLSPLSLIPSKRSKFQTARKHLPKDDFSSSLKTLDELADEMIKTNLEKLKKSGASFHFDSSDVEAIHDMRVSIRKMRAAMRTFKGVFPASSKKIDKELHRIFLILGKKRDLDIFLAFILLQPLKNSVALFPQVTHCMVQTKERIISTLQTKEYAHLIEALEQLEASENKQNRNIIKIAKNRVQMALNKVLEIAASIDFKTDDKTLHQLRISIKKLRYISEFFEPIFSESICSLDPLIEKCKRIQDILGEHQDAISGISMLICDKHRFTNEDFLQIKRAYELKKKRMRASFFKIWKDFWIGDGFRQDQPSTAIELILSI